MDAAHTIGEMERHAGNGTYFAEQPIHELRHTAWWATRAAVEAAAIGPKNWVATTVREAL